MPGKRVQSLDLFARPQKLADEAFDGLLKKHDRPVSLKDAYEKAPGTARLSITCIPPQKGCKALERVRTSGIASWRLCRCSGPRDPHWC
jgi:hypothetical protein